MKLVQLTVSNFKGIEAREIVAKGRHVKVRAGNGKGKSSTAGALLWGLTGDGTGQPIREGATRAEVEIDVGDFVFRRVATKDGRSEFKGRAKAGATMPATPAKFVRQLVGNGLALNPLSIYAMDDEEQARVILDALAIDVSAEERDTEDTYSARTEINRQRDAVDSRIRELVDKGAKADAPAPITATEVMARIELAERHAKDEAARVARVNDATSEHARRRIALVKAEQAVEDAQKAARAANDALMQADRDLFVANQFQAMPNADAEVAAARQELATLMDRNKSAELGAELRAKREESEKFRRQSERFTAQLDELAKARAAKIATAADKVGLDGLELIPGTKKLAVRGVKLAELNRAERIRFGLRVATAKLPELRVAIVDEAEGLDAESMRELMKWGENLDIQLVVLSVDPAGAPLTIDLVDGDDIELDPEPANAST